MAAMGARRLSTNTCSTSYSSQHSTTAHPPGRHITAARAQRNAGQRGPQMHPQNSLVPVARQRLTPRAHPSNWRLAARRSRDVLDDDFPLDDDAGEDGEGFDEEPDDMILEVLAPGDARPRKRSNMGLAAGEGDAEIDDYYDEEEEWEEDEAEGGLLDAAGTDRGANGGWDAALVNFSAEQDEVKVREWDTEEAGLKRRLNPPGAPLDRTKIEEFIPEEEPQPEARQAGDEFKLLTAADTNKLVTNRQGYQSFDMGGFELLVAQTPDGKLDLADSFVFDTAQDMYGKPEVQGQLPSGPGRYQVIPWSEEQLGDTMKNKAPSSKLLKLYFIGVASTHPYTVDMEAVFMFDGSRRVLSAMQVQKVGEVVDPILRIRPEGITIEDSGALPAFQLVAAGLEDQQYASEEERQEKMEELEQGLEDDLDDIPDAPAPDMM